MSNKLEKAIEWCVFQSRWLQVPVYLGMCVVMGMYSYVFCKEVIHSLINIETFTEETMLMLDRYCGCFNGFEFNHCVRNWRILVVCQQTGDY